MRTTKRDVHTQRLYGWLINMLALLLLIATLLLPNLYLYSPYFPRDIQAETPVLLGEIAEMDKISISHQRDQFGPFINLNMTGQFHKNLAANDRFIISTRVESQIKEFDFTFLIKKQLTNKNCVTSNPGCQITFSQKIYVPSGSTAENLHIITALHIDTETTRPDVISVEIKIYDSAALIPLKKISYGLLLILFIMYFTSHLSLLKKKEGWFNFIVTQIFLGNLFFILLSILVAMPCRLFLYWSCYHVTEFYLTWFLFITGWLASGFFGPIRYTGPTFVTMLAIGILLNRIKMEVFHTQIGGDDLRNLISLAEVISKQGSLLVMILFGGTIVIVALCITNKTIRQGICSSLLFVGYFFSFSLAAAVVSDKVIGSSAYLYGLESSEYNRGPTINFFERIGSLLWHKDIFSYPLSPPRLQIKPPVPLSIPVPPLFDTVIILQYESLWLGWQGGICQPAPHLTLPTTVQSLRKEILSPTTGGMTVLAEFEMNTGLPVALLKPGIVPYYYLDQQPPSLAHTALQLGYHTTFIHPFLRGFWGRDKAIPILGYQQQIYDEVYSPLQQKGLYISDMALADEIITYTKQQSAPQFIYAVSMQGHGPFNDQRYGKQQVDAACPGTTSAERSILNNYYTGVVDAMASLQHLLTQLDASGKRYLVLAFGDHQPYLMGAEELVLPKPPKRDSTFFIPFMAFTGGSTLDLARPYANADQLYQVSQQTSALLQKLPPKKLHGRLHPVLGMTPDFLLSDYQEQLRHTFLTGRTPQYP